MTQKFLVSVGTAIPLSKVAHRLSRVTADNVLCSVGLARSSNRSIERIALIGLGALLGAGTALLFAPSSGEEVRKRVADNLAKAAERSKELARKAKERAPELLEQAKEKFQDFEHVGKFGQTRYES